jgi:hypothetical protein
MQLLHTESDRLAGARAEIEALDLSLIKRKIACKEEGYGWTPEHTARIERGYRQFLTLLATNPGTQLAPTRDIDKFWHAHILNTRQYAADCERIFGEFLHHNPTLGMLGDEDKLDQAAQALHTLFEREFGEAVPANVVAPAESAWCGGETGAKKDAAWCGAEVGTKAEAAWCGAEVGAKKDVAWCGAEVGTKAEAAWCGAEVGAKRDVAWCGGELAAKMEAAWCGGEVGAKKQAAWCGAEVGAKKQAEVAWCGAEVLAH